LLIIEKWKQVQDTCYKVSDQGRVISYAWNRPHTLKPCSTKEGYKRVSINGRLTLVHRLVFESFVRRLEPKEQINHKNYIESDNRLTNLEAVSPSENIIHSRRCLSREEYEEIAAKLEEGYSQADLTREYNTSNQTISNIFLKKHWIFDQK